MLTIDEWLTTDRVLEAEEARLQGVVAYWKKRDPGESTLVTMSLNMAREDLKRVRSARQKIKEWATGATREGEA